MRRRLMKAKTAKEAEVPAEMTTAEMTSFRLPKRKVLYLMPMTVPERAEKVTAAVPAAAGI